MRLSNVSDFNYRKHHQFDNYTGLGHKYEQDLLNRVVSKEMFANPLNDIPLRQIERLIEYLVNSVKMIKLHYNIALPKNSKQLN